MSNTQFRKCPYPIGAFSGITIDGKTLIAGQMRCNSWDCPYCHGVLKKKLYRRIHQGIMSNMEVGLYGRKFLTLTYGGMYKRETSDPLAAYEEMSLSFHKLIKALRAYYGFFHYFKVCELHADGWPHFHVMLVGDTIAPKDVLDKVRSLWCGEYGLGFVKLNAVKFNDAKHATNYMLKYITKDIKKVGPGKRIFTASRDALLKVAKPRWLGSPLVHLGSRIHNMMSRSITLYRDSEVLHLKGWKQPCIKVGKTIIELRDWQERQQILHFKRMTVL